MTTRLLSKNLYLEDLGMDFVVGLFFCLWLLQLAFTTRSWVTESCAFQKKWKPFRSCDFDSVKLTTLLIIQLLDSRWNISSLTTLITTLTWSSASENQFKQIALLEWKTTFVGLVDLIFLFYQAKTYWFLLFLLWMWNGYHVPSFMLLSFYVLFHVILLSFTSFLLLLNS